MARHHLREHERQALVQAARDAGVVYPHSVANLIAEVVENILLTRIEETP